MKTIVTIHQPGLTANQLKNFNQYRQGRSCSEIMQGASDKTESIQPKNEQKYGEQRHLKMDQSEKRLVRKIAKNKHDMISRKGT